MEDFCPTMQRCDVMELLPFFLDTPVDSPPVNVTPSRLLSELQMPMQKRFEQLTRTTRKRRILTEVNTFMKTPDIIVFQNFEAYETYKTTLTFVNTKSTSKNLKIGLAYKSPFFSIIRPGSDYDFLKVAPGIAYVINIIFTPTEMRDYVAKLVCETNEEIIIIPIYGIGTRPLLKIVDEIKLNPTAVRVKSEKSILLHNLADKSGQYRVTVEEPFDIFPQKAVLESNKAHELKVFCTPITAEKNLNSRVILHCDDLILNIPVTCEVQEADISLQCFCLNFFEVFVGLQNCGITTVYNNSPFTVDFQWKLLESEKEDVESIKSMLRNLKSLTEMEKQKYAKLQYHDVINAEGHEQILDYKFREMAENINEEFKLMYANEAFSILPLEGKILPHQSFDFNLIFAPTKTDVYLSSAYLDVTGRYERFHLNLSGVGRGPAVVFNVNKLNTGIIFLEAEHEYQVIVKNDGCIPATVIFQKTETEFGGEINCNPEAQYLKKNDSCKPFIVRFSSTVQGPFVEKVFFKIKESQELIFFLLIGNVVCPLLKPDVEKLDFGHMAFATEIRKQVILTNPSQVPIDFQVKMSKINYSEMLFDGKKEKKQDFSYDPNEGVVSPYASVTVEVKLFTNVIDSVNETMIICMYGSDVYKIEIPCSYTCLIPTITCDPQDIYITFCFLNFVYKRTLTFTNETGLTGQFNYTPMEEPKNMRVSLSPTEMLIPPHDKFEVELTITTDVLGLHEYPLMFTLVGQETPTRYCNLKCNGQGPVVSYFPDTINFGQVQLLTTAVKQMSVVNDSPIKAKIFLTSTNKAEVQLPVEELDLFPECEVQVDVICYLTEDGKFDCQIYVDVENGENIVIKVNGEGIGYPLQCVPKLEPEYDLGSHLTYLTNKLPVSISNLGRKYYRIYWSRKSYVKSLKELLAELETPLSPNAIFWFEPNYLELGENFTESVDICARSKTAHYYEESFYMYGTIDPNSKSNCLQVVIPIMTVLLKVKFIVPVMSFSTQHLKFMEMHVPSFHDPYCTADEPGIPLESISTREVVIRNEVEIPLTLMMRTTDDFLIKLYQDEYEDTYYHKLEVGREVTVTIEFQPQQFSKRYIKSVGKLIVNIPEYPKTESIFLTGEMCFPSIQFLPQELHFGCLEIGSYNVRTIIMQNVTFLPVKYSLNLLTDTFHLQQLPQEATSVESTVPDLTLDNISMTTEIHSNIKIKQTTLQKETLKEKSNEQAAEIFEEGVINNVHHSTSGFEENEEKTEHQNSLQQKRSSCQSSKEEDKREAASVAFGNVEDEIKIMIDGTKPSLRDIKSPSDERLLESFASQDILQPTMEIDPQKVKDTAKTILNHLLYNKYEEADSTNLETRDFWTEMKRTDSTKTHILKNIITMEPWQGCLKPYEYNLINLYFHPLPNTIIHCSAICKIEGGEEDRIQFSGSCSNIAYSFDKTSIDVGRQLFCEILQTSLTLSNNGFYDFPVVVRCDDEEIFFNKKIKANWLNIFPRSYFLEAGKSVEFKVSYFPGMTGVFEEDLIFDIAFLDPIKIPLKGYAVFSQVIINIPREELHHRYRKISYRGIASVNERYLLSELPRKRTIAGGLKSERMSRASIMSRSSVISHMSVEFEDRMDAKFTSLQDEEWEIIFRDDPMPSVKDLDLAVEQTILNDQLCINYDELKKHSITRKCRIIPDFKVPAYRLDFGNVIVDTSVVFSLRITNISPEPAVVKVLKSNLLSLYANDLSIEYKPTLLNYNESLPMHIMLRPNFKSSNSMGYDDKCIRDIVYLAVSHGATIPIVITATVALPRFGFIHKCIDFGMIKIGNAFRQSVIIENRGCLTCYWDTEVRSLNDMKPSYYVIPNKGELLAFEQGIMNIYFMPEKKGFCSAEVVVQVQGSPRQVKMKLCGDGVQPTLVFKEANVKFSPCIPYTTDTVELLIQNVSTFPIEFCFSDFEQCYDEEKMLVELFLNYYNLKTVLIPERELGGGIPEIFISTYQMLENDLKKIFRNVQSEDGSETDMLAGYTKEKIVDLIKENLNAVIEEEAAHEKQENTTDIYAVENKGIEGLAIIDPVIPIDGLTEKKGVVVIFHGAPKTEYIRTALSAAKFFSLEPYSIDKLIYDELINGRSNSTEIINNVIDDALNDYEDSVLETEQDDEYDILEKKINIIIHSKLIVKKKGLKEDKTVIKEDDKEMSKTERSKSHHERRGQTKDKKGAETLLEISPEYFADILKTKIEKMLVPSLVIESLDSVFVRSPILALECLLHGIGYIRYIQVVILSLTLEEYLLDEAKLMLNEELKEKKVFTQANKEKANKEKSDKKEVIHKISTSINVEEKADHKLDEKIHEISRDMTFELDQRFKAFGIFLLDLNDVCESWNRRYCALADVESSAAPATPGPMSLLKFKKVKKKSLSGLLKFTNKMTVLDSTNCGIPLIIIDNALSNTENYLLDSINRTLYLDEELNAALESVRSRAKLENIQESNFMYSVVKGITRYNKNLSYVFQIINTACYIPTEEMTDEAETASIYSIISTALYPAESTYKTGKSRRKKKSYGVKSDHILQDLTIKSEYQFCSRTVISPGEILKYEISFNPQSLGVFSHKYRLEIIGYRPSLFVKCQANSILPKLDYTPEVMFNKCIDSVVDKRIDDNFIYIKDVKLLDFGTILAAGARTPPYYTKIKLKTISYIPCQTTVQLEEQSQFTIRNSNEYVIPNEMEVEIEVSIQGKRKGNVDSELYIAITNNPLVYRLKLTAEVVPLDFSFFPHFLNFDKIPLDYLSRQYIKLTNSTSVNLKWRFVRYDWATRIYKISKLRGEIKLYSVDRVEFEFKPTREDIYLPRTIDIQVFDPLCSEEIPLLVEPITLQSEAVEILVNCVDFIDLGDIKGKKEYKFPLKINNNGKTSVQLMIEKMVNPAKAHFHKVRRIFQYSTNSEILHPNKNSGITIKFNPTEEIEFQAVPVFLCQILDPNKPQNVVKKFQIKYSATVILSKFSICPVSDVHFGSLEVWNKRTQMLQLKNIGKASFSYDICYVNPNGTDASLQKVVEEKKTKENKHGRSSFSKLKNVSNLNSLEIPGYTIFPSNGNVEVGQSAEITLIFQPNSLGIYKERVLLTVSEPAKEHIDGKEITLYGEASEPWIDFTTLRKMFKEHYIVNSEEDLVVPSDIGTHTYFVVSKNTLYFENVCVKKECQAKIYLQNLGQLIAVVVGKVHNSNNFTVYPTQFTVDPYLTEVITVTFKPDSINTFEATLEIGSNATTNNIFELTLRGRSYVPQIKLTELPPPEENENMYKIFFKPTYLKKIEFQKVKIINIGVIACQVIIDVTDSGKSMFYILESDKFLEFNKEIDNNLVASSLKINLNSFESIDVYLVFKPNKEVIISSFINLFIIDNPFETYQIEVFGQCYGGDIYINNLETFNPKKWSLQNKTVAYLLDLGQTPLKLLQKKCFTVTNNSEKEIYRFEFCYDVHTLKLIPRVGHLKPLSSKEILAVNMSNVPNTISKEVIYFQYISIKYITEEPITISWDERQQLLSWIETGIGIVEDAHVQQYFRNCVETATEAFLKMKDCKKEEITEKLKLSLEREEPDIMYNSDEWKIIDIMLSFTTDYALYSHTTTELHFPDTFIRDKSELSFKVKNCGRVPIFIDWKFIIDGIAPKYPFMEIIKSEQEDGSSVDVVSSFESCLSATSIHIGSQSEVYISHPHLLEIVPKKTTIPVKETCEFRVIFSPLSACHYTVRLTSEIESLHPDLKNMQISITAESLHPDYYFELEDSDYLARRTMKRCLKFMDANFKILEIHAVGVGITTVKHFFVLNTSYLPLNFKIKRLEQGDLSYFNCKTPSGTIQKRKKFELVFAFTSQELGTFEDEYLFKTDRKPIDKELQGSGIETKFLIVGICRNPRVYFKRAHINLTPTLLRIPTQETIFLKNEEDDELGFKIIKESLLSYDHLQKLKIMPNSGCISPKTEITMRLIYNAETVGDSTFSVQCVVDRMTTPLTLNVSTKCLEVECKIQYIDQCGEEITLDPNIENIIDLGKIGIKTKNNMTFIFSNMGKTGFFYTWHYKKINIEHLINVSPKKDKEFISSGSSVKRELTFETFKKYNLANFPMKIEISYGPIYNLKFFVAAEFPSCKLSFTYYNFGNCLIQPVFTKNYTNMLIVKNFEPIPVKLDNIFENNENLTVDFKTELIQPQCKKKLPFYFHPKKEGHYEFMVPIVLNCTRRFIKINGCGVKINLQLTNPSDKFIDLGEVKLGETSRHTFFVVNRTPTPLDTTLFLSQDFPVEKKEFEKLKPEITVPVPFSTIKLAKNLTQGKMTGKKKKEERLNTTKTSITKDEDTSLTVAVMELQKPYFFIEPNSSIKMDFNKKYQFVVEFQPNERLESFSQKIFYKIQDFVAPLCSVKGKCLIAEFSLDKEILTFSNVLIDATRVKYVLLRNTGDLPLRFRWQNEHLEYFKVHPIEGYVKPKSDVKVDFSFKVSTIKFQLVKKCICIINNKHPLELTLVANSITKPPPVSTIIFSCPVRQKITQNVDIANKTTTLWHLYPVLSNKNFIIPSEIVVEPESVSAVPVEYHPKLILDEQATLILPLPDEEILYEFIGKTLPPLPEKKLSIEIKSKQNYWQVLPVYNSTDFKQCFEVETVLMTPPTPKLLFKTFGLNLVELLPGEVKEYKWNIYVINEEPLELQVIFKDKQSNEYMFYEISVKVLPPEPIDTLQLTTCVRQPVKTKIKLKNPINVPVEFYIVSPCLELHFKNVIIVEPYSKQELDILYYPVKNGEFVTTLEVKSEELGVLTYILYLMADIPEVEKILQYIVELGSREYATADIKNTFSVPMDIYFKFDDTEFWAEKYAKTILPGETATFTIVFEPSDLGVLESKFVISSAISGPYIFQLYGECIPPTPKGPFLIKPGGNTYIPFFNPFNETREFKYSLDSKIFELRITSEEIKSKKSTKIIVTCPEYVKGQGNVSCSYTGKLAVSCERVKWSYYIQTE